MTPTQEIDAKIATMDDWRGPMLSRLRKAILAADRGVAEDVKWRKPTNPGGVPAWSCDGLICTGETYRDKVKLTFASGAALPDPAGLFNASLDGNARRAIDVAEGGKVDAKALTALVRAAIAHNRAKAKPAGAGKPKTAKAAAKKTAAPKKPVKRPAKTAPAKKR